MRRDVGCLDRGLYLLPARSFAFVADFDAAYLRKGASYHDTRMMFYCMPHWPGNTPEHLMQNAVMQWANNVKDLDWFNASPDGWTTENYIAYRGGLPMWKMLRTISGMAGAIEDDLLPARPEKTPVAMLISQASDFGNCRERRRMTCIPRSTANQRRRRRIFHRRNAKTSGMPCGSPDIASIS